MWFKRIINSFFGIRKKNDLENDLKNVTLFRDKQKFIEENISKRSQIPNLNEVEGFATKS